MSVEVQKLYLKQPYVRRQWEKLLLRNGLCRLDEDIESSYGIWNDDQLVATLSYEGQVLKYLAIDRNFRDGGACFNRLVSFVINELAYIGRFHIFAVPKLQYQHSFEQLGFQMIVANSKAALMEKGTPDIHNYLLSLPQPKKGAKKIGAIVMNANPFTLGHRYLVERAVAEMDEVYLFVLAKEQSVFTTDERMRMVKDGVADLPVHVISGGDYLISPATFPAYFLKIDDDKAAFQADMDIRLFKKWIVPYLNITDRFVGEERHSPMTDTYNKTMETLLPPEVRVHLIPRKEVDCQVISASTVRQKFKEEDWTVLKKMLPKTSLEVLKSKKEELANEN